jgi:hypothetical protein
MSASKFSRDALTINSPKSCGRARARCWLKLIEAEAADFLPKRDSRAYLRGLAYQFMIATLTAARNRRLQKEAPSTPPGWMERTSPA